MAVAAPDNHQVLVFLTQLVAILLVARTLGYLLHRVGQPAVVGELLAGVVLGPSVLGKIAPGAFDWLFPDGDMQSGMLYAVAWLGLVLMLSAAGFESDLGVLKKLGRPVAIISVASLVVPMIAGFALGMVTVADLRGIDTTTTIFALFIAVALSISSLPVAVRVLSEMGMIRRDVGQLILACAIANDVVGWVVLGVVVADCVPILLSDAGAGVIGVIHAGRPGFTAGIVDITLDAMAGLGARDIRAVVGPSVCGRCYEVPVTMVSEAAEVAPEATAVSWSGTPAIDVASGVIARMAARGASVTWLSGCTREDDTLYSYRRDGTTGRFAGLIWREHSGAEAAGQQR